MTKEHIHHTHSTEVNCELFCAFIGDRKVLDLKFWKLEESVNFPPTMPFFIVFPHLRPTFVLFDSLLSPVKSTLLQPSE
jgi:hypothetical protein